MEKNLKIKKLNDFIKMEKFEKDEVSFYPGLSNEKFKIYITQLFNMIAMDFIECLKNGCINKDFQNKIKAYLEKINKEDFDSEDQDRICLYFEDLMDILGLKNSEGNLNNWRYGFNPNNFVFN